MIFKSDKSLRVFPAFCQAPLPRGPLRRKKMPEITRSCGASHFILQRMACVSVTPGSPVVAGEAAKGSSRADDYVHKRKKQFMKALFTYRTLRMKV